MAHSEMPARIYAELDPETNDKRWYSTKGMGNEYVRVPDDLDAKLYAAALHQITTLHSERLSTEQRAHLADAIVREILLRKIV